MRKLVTQGEYGVVYTFKVNRKRYILKRNANRDVDLTHEWNIAKELEKYSQLQGFYPKAIELRQSFTVNIDNSDPNIRTHYQDLIMEHVHHENTFYNLLPHMTLTQKENVYIHLVEMLRTMQHYCKFVHYDLHLNNILLVLNKGVKRKYLDKTIVVVKYMPVLIDFGFSYCENVKGYNAPLTQTHRGMTPILHNDLYDIHTLQYELQNDINFRRKIQKWPRMQTSLFDILCTVCNIVYGKFPDTQQDTQQDTIQDALQDTSNSWVTNHSHSIKTILEVNLCDKLQSINENDVAKFSEHTHLMDDECKNVLLFWILQFKIYYLNWMETKRKFIESTCINSLK